MIASPILVKIIVVLYILSAISLLVEQPVSVQLRYLQTLTEIGVKKHPFPVPVDIFSRITKALEV